MKKHFLALAAFALTFQLASAQTEKGNQTLGLNLIYQHTKDNNFVPNPYPGYLQNQSLTQDYWRVGPQYSYFIANGLDLGVGLDYAYTSIENSYISTPIKQSTKGYGANLFLRKYFLYNNKFGFRTGALAGYSYSKVEDNASSSFITAGKVNQIYGNLMLDLVYYPSKKIGVTATLANVGYSHSKSDNGLAGTGTSDTFHFNFVSSLPTISVFYTFGGK